MTMLKVGTENKNDILLNYHDYGTGKPVVLIHGWPLSARSWENQIPKLVEAGCRVVAYDRRGFGDSTQTWEGYNYDTFASDLNALMTHLDLKDATLVGFSMGGGEVVRYISKYGTTRVAKAVLAAAVPPFLYKSKENPEGALDDATIASFEQAVRSDRPAFLDSFVGNFFSAGKNHDLVSEAQRRYNRNIAEMASPKGTEDCIAAFGRTDFRGDLAKMTIPTLIIHGDQDGIVPFENSGKRAHQAIAGSEMVLIKGAPHGLNVTHKDEFNKALINFIKK